MSAIQYRSFFAVVSLGLLLASCAGLGSGADDQSTVTEVPASRLGEPIAGLTPDELAAFHQGFEAFSEEESADDGLGPVFNDRSCKGCHANGAIGGAAPNRQGAVVTRIGGIGANGYYSDLVSMGGPVLQARSLQEFDSTCPIGAEYIPSGVQFVSRRLTTPVFGAGLIEAIPDSEIQALADTPRPDGISGHVQNVVNPLTGLTEIGRFGWKAQHSNLEVFAADAYLNEMGVTSTIFPTENLPQGMPIPSGWDSVVEPEDQDGDVEKFAQFMRFLAPPVPMAATDAIANQLGQQSFNEVGCANCHVPNLTTGPSTHAALANKIVRLYSDLLLHDMGAGLADGIVQGSATGSEFRTAPLWGISSRPFLLHDGRATTITEAVQQHGGEAGIVRDRYFSLPKKSRDALDGFVKSL